MSFSRVVIGVFIAVALSIITSVFLMQLTAKARNHFLVRLFFEIPKFPPPIAWIPIVILFFGIGEKSAWVVVAIGAYPSLSTIFLDSLLQFPKPILLYARSLRLSFLTQLYQIYIKALAPELMTALRVSFGMGWMCIVAAEMISANSGLGYLIQIHRLDLNYEMVLFDIFLIGLVGYLLHTSLIFIEKKLCPWTQNLSEKKYA